MVVRQVQVGKEILAVMAELIVVLVAVVELLLMEEVLLVDPVAAVLDLRPQLQVVQ
jgi:hypothetical protein